MSLAPIAAVEYLEAALAFASNHRFGVAIVQLELVNMSVSGIRLFGDQSRAFRRRSRDSCILERASAPSP